MTVEQLIEELKGEPQNAEVFISHEVKGKSGSTIFEAYGIDGDDCGGYDEDEPRTFICFQTDYKLRIDRS
jgi:hypothetical protein